MSRSWLVSWQPAPWEPRALIPSSHPAAARRRHRCLQQMLVELYADLADMARLFLAQQVAGTADVEVVARELETGAEGIQRLHYLEPTLGGRGQHAARRQRQVAVGAQLGPPDAAAKLVELGEAE